MLPIISHQGNKPEEEMGFDTLSLALEAVNEKKTREQQSAPRALTSETISVVPEREKNNEPHSASYLLRCYFSFRGSRYLVKHSYGRTSRSAQR